MACWNVVMQQSCDVGLQSHWAPKLGAKFMTDEEAQAAGAKNMRHRCAPPVRLALVVSRSFFFMSLNIIPSAVRLETLSGLSQACVSAAAVTPRTTCTTPLQTVGG